jgi:hypothetical protein
LRKWFKLENKNVLKKREEILKILKKEMRRKDYPRAKSKSYGGNI